MLTLYHHPFSSASRFIRLIIGEYGLSADLIVERTWERRQEFLMHNPAGTVPVLIENDGPAICGAPVIMEYLDETRGPMAHHRLMPDNFESRAEMRRLVDWFLTKLEQETVMPLARERIYKLEMPKDAGGGAPDSAVLRAARANMRTHIRYVGYLAGTRNWLAGERMTYADLAAAAALSVCDYLGEVPWAHDDNVKNWYARIKSRPGFRTLLTDAVRGLPAAQTYADLDF